MKPNKLVDCRDFFKKIKSCVWYLRSALGPRIAVMSGRHHRQTLPGPMGESLRHLRGQGPVSNFISSFVVTYLVGVEMKSP